MSTLNYDGFRSLKVANKSPFGGMEYNNLISVKYEKGCIVKMPLRAFLQRLNLNSHLVPPAIWNMPVKNKRFVYGLVDKVVTDHDGTIFLEVKWAVFGLFYRGSHIHSEADMGFIDQINVYCTEVSRVANADGTYVTANNDHQEMYIYDRYIQFFF